MLTPGPWPAALTSLPHGLRAGGYRACVPFESQVAVRRVGGSRPWQLLEPFCYLDTADLPGATGLRFTTPAGYRTDWATIPRLLQWAVSKLGPWDEPAIPHDLGCDALREAWEQRRAGHLEPREPWLDAREVDLLWWRGLRDVGVGPVLAHLLWCAVRVGALGSRYRWAGWWRDAPAVLSTGAVVGVAAWYAVRLLDAAAHALS